MRNLIYFFGLCLIIGCSKEKKGPDRPFHGLKGEVKILSQNSYTAEEKFGEVVKGEKTSDFFTDWKRFDKKGNLVEVRDFNVETGEIERKNIYLHEEDHLTEVIMYNGNNEVEGRWEMKYNSDGLRTEAIKFEEGKAERKNVYEYDDVGNMVSQRSYHTGMREPGIYSLLKYNDQGQVIERNSFFSDGERYERSTFSYEGDKLTKEKTFDEEGLSSINKYDGEDMLLERESYLNGELDLIMTYEYTFDSVDNWITRKEFMTSVQSDYIKDSPISITERRIEYY